MIKLLLFTHEYNNKSNNKTNVTEENSLTLK